MSTAGPHTPWIAPAPDDAGPPRALVLSGGGIRLSYQAGVLRALAEEGLRFHHVDATSGGALNLAMLLSGLDPGAMAERWRTLDLRRSISLMPLSSYLSGDAFVAMGSADGFREYVLPHLGIDLAKVRAAQGVQGTFNVLNYNRKVTEAVPHQEMDEDLLIAGLSLPGVMPPVPRGDTLYLDAAFIRDANLMEAVRRGAEELWVVWCLGNTTEYLGGPLRLYVQMLEMAANGSLHREFEQIDELNARIRAGDSPYGQTQPVRLHLIRPPVALPLDPDLYLGLVRADTLLARGHTDARAYLGTRTPDGLPFHPDVTRMSTPRPGITFRETMSGPFALGETDPEHGRATGARAGNDLTLHATIHIPDIAQFKSDPTHAGSIEGEVVFAPLGGPFPARAGQFNLFSPTDQPTLRRMVYEVAFEHDGEPFYLAGHKDVRDETGLDLWTDTTTLFARLHRGSDTSSPVVGAGVLRLGVDDLARLVSTIRPTDVGSVSASAGVIATFGQVFLGALWDRYAKLASRVE